MSFYGRGKPATFLTFDKIYPSYTEMMDNVNSDEVFLSRYVLIEYGSDQEYEANATKDNVNYDSTVWKKVKNSDGKFTYIKIADLNTTNPGFTIELTEPSDTPKVELDKTDNDKNEYTIKMPKPWGFKQGDLEFNEKGFNPDIHYIDDKEDKIAVEDDGEAKKWSIVLPSVGNSIAEVWDIIYGAAANDEARNTDIAWDSYSGLRLINRDENGYTFDKDNVATVAGCINSVHDLMGQIIVDDVSSGIEINDASIDKIYYRTNEEGYTGFYVKDKTYELNDGDPEAESAGELLQFESKKYYYLDGKDYKAADKYEFGKNYYDLTGLLEEKVINEEPYKADTYWEGILNGYQLSTFPDFNDWAQYYIFNAKTDSQQLTDSIKNIKADTTKLRLFFIPEQPPIEGEDLQGLFYQRGEVNEENDYFPVLSTTTLEDDMHFFWIKNYAIGEGADATTGQMVKIYNWDNGAQIIPVEIVSTPDVYYTYDSYNNIFFVADDKKHTKAYYSFINDPVPVDIFYHPETYYYKSGDDYYYGVQKERIPGVTYYKLKAEPPVLKFYEPNKFYYVEDNKYILDTNEEMTQDRAYFNYSEWYVVSDANNLLAPGAPWSSEATPPEGVKVGSRKEIWVWKELRDFARSLNTIHGLIIHINSLLKTGDMITRDRDTVQGCINSINDILDRINALTPGCLVATDKYNRFVTTQLIDVPLSGYESPNFGEEILVNPEDTLKAALQRIETKYADLTSDGHGVKVESDPEEAGMFKLTLI